MFAFWMLPGKHGESERLEEIVIIIILELYIYLQNANVVGGRQTWNKVGGISWDHADQTLRTDILFCAVSAAVALFLVDDDTSVDQAHRMLLTDFDAGTDADAAALTFASGETALNRFLAGRASGEAFLSGSSSVTSHERNCVLRC